MSSDLGNQLQQVGRLEKIGQWDHGIRTMIFVACVIEECCCYDCIYCYKNDDFFGACVLLKKVVAMTIICWYENDDFCSMCGEEDGCYGSCCCCCCKNGASCEAGDVFLAGICSLFFGWAVFIVGEYSLNKTAQVFINFPE